MPELGTMLARLNETFAPPNIGDLSADQFDGSASLPQLASDLGIAQTDRERDFLIAIPPGMQRALLGFILDDLQQQPRVPINFAWAAAPGWELGFVYPGPCGHHVTVRSPYRSDFPL